MDSGSNPDCATCSLFNLASLYNFIVFKMLIVISFSGVGDTEGDTICMSSGYGTW